MHKCPWRNASASKTCINGTSSGRAAQKQTGQSQPAPSHPFKRSLWVCCWQSLGCSWCVQWLCCVIKCSTSPGDCLNHCSQYLFNIKSPRLPARHPSALTQMCWALLDSLSIAEVLKQAWAPSSRRFLALLLKIS